MSEQPLNGTSEFTWEMESTGELTIYSPCCGDTFSPTQLQLLYDTLKEHYE